jgi:hypothetical protein
MSNQLDFQLSAWPAQREQRAADGEQFDKPRPVEHFFTFKNKNDADAAVAELRSLNFEANVTKRGLFKTVVYATHVSDLRDQTVTQFLTTVVGVANKHSGIYDGFGAFIEA